MENVLEMNRSHRSAERYVYAKSTPFQSVFFKSPFLSAQKLTKNAVNN